VNLEKVYREQYRALVGFVQRRIGDRARAEDIAQEAFVRAIRHQPQRPRAWLYTVAANLIRDAARRDAVARRHLRVVGQATRADPPADETWLRREEGKRVRAALENLGNRDRQALLLKQEGLSYEQIATRLGLSLGSVGTTLSRARRRLVQAYQRDAVEGGIEDAAR